MLNFGKSLHLYLRSSSLYIQTQKEKNELIEKITKFVVELKYMYEKSV